MYVADAARVVDALDGLAALDTLSDALPFERFREAVGAALEGLRAADVLRGALWLLDVPAPDRRCGDK